MRLLLFPAVSEHTISQSRFTELFGDENAWATEPGTLRITTMTGQKREVVSIHPSSPI